MSEHAPPPAVARPVDMPRSELRKLVLLALFAGVAFAAGFFLGRAREEYIWQEEAIAHESADWVQPAGSDRWKFRWRNERVEKR